jgi:hypothetical protein
LVLLGHFVRYSSHTLDLLGYFVSKRFERYTMVIACRKFDETLALL